MLRNILLLGIALLLIFAVAAKLHGQFKDAHSSSLVVPSSSIQMTIILIETGMALWILSGQYRTAAWLATLMLFSIFFMLSIYLTVNQQVSCNCFGAMSIRPFYMVVIDGSIITLLVIFHPTIRFDPLKTTQCLKWLLRLSALSASIVTVILAVLYLAYGDISLIFNQLKGDTIIIDKPIVNLGKGQHGDKVDIEYTLSNISNKPVRIYGGSSTCHCVVTDDLPITIPPHDSKRLNICVIFNGNPGVVLHQYFFYVD